MPTHEASGKGATNFGGGRFYGCLQISAQKQDSSAGLTHDSSVCSFYTNTDGIWSFLNVSYMDEFSIQTDTGPQWANAAVRNRTLQQSPTLRLSLRF